MVLKGDALTAAANAGEELVVVVEPETKRGKRLRAAVHGNGIAVVAVVFFFYVVGKH